MQMDANILNYSSFWFYLRGRTFALFHKIRKKSVVLWMNCKLLPIFKKIPIDQVYIMNQWNWVRYNISRLDKNLPEVENLINREQPDTWPKTTVLSDLADYTCVDESHFIQAFTQPLKEKVCDGEVYCVGWWLNQDRIIRVFHSLYKVDRNYIIVLKGFNKSKKDTSSGAWPDARDYCWFRSPIPNQLS